MRTTSTERSAMRLASSWMVMVSGSVTSRAIFSFGSLSRWPLMRWTRRRDEANEGILLGARALFVFAELGAGERLGAGAALLLGERAQHDAGGFRRGGGSSRSCRRRGPCARWRGGLFRCCAPFGSHGLRFALGGADAAFDLFDDDGLAAAMAEALAHDALLDAAALERQRLRRAYAQLVTAILVRLGHPYPFLNASISRAGLARRCETARGAANAPKTCRSGARQAGLHVSHFGALMPNPIVPRSGGRS